MKVCKTCNIEKPLSEYHIAQKPGYVGTDGYERKTTIYKAHCKECCRKKQISKYHDLTPEEKKSRRDKYGPKDPDYLKRYKLKNNYGLTLEEFSGMILEQNSCCKICKENMDNPQVDHCHTTGKVRGLLCRDCNISLGLLKENTQTLHNMIEYINDYI
jgi:hypothetical protein